MLNEWLFHQNRVMCGEKMPEDSTNPHHAMQAEAEFPMKTASRFKFTKAETLHSNFALENCGMGSNLADDSHQQMRVPVTCAVIR